jgi:hypothetical protein
MALPRDRVALVGDLENDLRWNPLASKPRVAAELEARGCFVRW